MSESLSGSAKLKQLLEALQAQSASDVDQSTRSDPLDPATAETALVEPGDDATSSDPGGYIPAIYDAQKDIGLRRPNGALKLSKLKPNHKKIIALHLSGWPNNEIAQALNYSASWVSTVLNDPLAQQVIANFDDLHEEEFKRLRPLATSAVRDALQPHKPDSTRLRAAKIFRDAEKDRKDETAQTAEDIMGKILQQINAENVQVNVNIGKTE